MKPFSQAPTCTGRIAWDALARARGVLLIPPQEISSAACPALEGASPTLSLQKQTPSGLLTLLVLELVLKLVLELVLSLLGRRYRISFRGKSSEVRSASAATMHSTLLLLLQLSQRTQ